MTPDFNAVRDVLLVYLDGIYNSDTQKLREALHPEARYVCAVEDDLINYSMEEYFPIVDKRPSPAGKGQARADRIESIRFAGPKTAFACLYCVVGEKHFTDFLTLIKTDGAWRIISKIFHYDLVSQSTAPESSA